MEADPWPSNSAMHRAAGRSEARGEELDGHQVSAAVELGPQPRDAPHEVDEVHLVVWATTRAPRISLQNAGLAKTREKTRPGRMAEEKARTCAGGALLGAVVLDLPLRELLIFAGQLLVKFRVRRGEQQERWACPEGRLGRAEAARLRVLVPELEKEVLRVRPPGSAPARFSARSTCDACSRQVGRHVPRQHCIRL